MKGITSTIRKNYIYFTISILFLVWMFFAFIMLIDLSSIRVYFPNAPNKSDLGNAFGIINSMFTVISVFFILKTLENQQEQLKQQNNHNELSLKNQQEQLNHQQEQIKKQDKFNKYTIEINQFYKLLESKAKFVNEIFIRNSIIGDKQGSMAITLVYDAVISDLKTNPNIQNIPLNLPSEDLKKRNEIYESNFNLYKNIIKEHAYKSYIDNLFNRLAIMLKFTYFNLVRSDEEDFEYKRKHYYDLMRFQMTDVEYNLLCLKMIFKVELTEKNSISNNELLIIIAPFFSDMNIIKSLKHGDKCIDFFQSQKKYVQEKRPIFFIK